MELSPHAVSVASFSTVKKGYDPDEVRAFLTQVASTLESAQQQSTAMEARARAAIAKLQELQQQPASSAPATDAPASEPAGLPDEAETISRTLLLAQRTADATIADANAQAASIVDAANHEARGAVERARADADAMVESARAEARRAKDDELARAEAEVQSLLARRDFLVADVDHLEQHLQAQRERLREAAATLTELVERVPGGLGEMRRPLLSASDSSPRGIARPDTALHLDDTDAVERPVADELHVAAAAPDADDSAGGGPEVEDVVDGPLAATDATPAEGALPFDMTIKGEELR